MQAAQLAESPLTPEARVSKSLGNLSSQVLIMSDLVRDSAFRRNNDSQADSEDERELSAKGRGEEQERDLVADHVLLRGGDAGTKGTGSSG
jgi:hypothetical protein